MVASTTRNLKRVLYIGQLWAGSTCVPRLQGLRQVGLDILDLDSTNWLDNTSRWINAFVVRTYLSPKVWRLNAQVVELSAWFKPDLIWVDKGTWIYPNTLRRLRRHVPFIIHYNTDDLFAPVNYFWLHRLGLKAYDLYLTTNRYNVTEIPRQFGIPSIRVGMGYDQNILSQHSSTAEKRYDLVFVGHWEPNTEKQVKLLLEHGLNIRIWGHNWRKAQMVTLRDTIPLPYEKYISLLLQSKIGLCFLSRWNRNESTGRSFEIPATQTFMLADNTLEHNYLYGDGVGVALFSTSEELVRKAKYYLSHEAEREQVARCGHNRCKKMKLSWQEQIQHEWNIIERVLNSGIQSLVPEDDLPFWTGFRMGNPWNPSVCTGPQKLNTQMGFQTS